MDLKENADKIKTIFNSTLSSIDTNKSQMFTIIESVRNEHDILQKEYLASKKAIDSLIKQVTKLEVDVAKGKNELVKVSKNFNTYSEDDIRAVYNNVEILITELATKREEEKQTIHTRNNLERRLEEHKKILADTERLFSQISVALNLLSGNMETVMSQITDVAEKSFIGMNIIEALEEERSRIARDIHDGPAQSFSNIVLTIELIKKMIVLDKDKAIEELTSLADIARNNISGIRKIIYDLKPFDMNEGGLLEGIKILSGEFSQHTNINVEVKALSNIDYNNNLVNLTLYRIVKESFNNIKKHAHAKNVVVLIEKTKEYIRLSVKDDGVGFTPDMPVLDEYEHGFGVDSMKRQCKYLGAEFKITSSPGMGTKVTLKIPIEEEGV